MNQDDIFAEEVDEEAAAEKARTEQQSENPYSQYTQNPYQTFGATGQPKYDGMTGKPLNPGPQPGQTYVKKDKKTTMGLGVAAMVLGIISLLFFCNCCNIVLSILAIVFGFVQICTKDNKKGKIFAWVGIATAVIGIVSCIAFWSISLNKNGVYGKILNDENFMDDYWEYYYNITPGQTSPFDNSLDENQLYDEFFKEYQYKNWPEENPFKNDPSVKDYLEQFNQQKDNTL